MNNSKLTTYQKKKLREEIRSWRFFILLFYTLAVVSAAASFFAPWLMLVSLAFVGLCLTAVYGAVRLTKIVEANQ